MLDVVQASVLAPYGKKNSKPKMALPERKQPSHHRRGYDRATLDKMLNIRHGK